MYDEEADANEVRGLPGRKPGRKPTFSRQDAISAAFSEGIGSFTLAGVAKRLGVAPPAIYRLFPSRDDLVDACLDYAVATIKLPQKSDPWQKVLRLWADECWRLCETYPGLSHLVFSVPTALVRAESVISEYVNVLMRHGKSPRQGMFAMDFIGDTVFASHLGVQALRDADAQGETGLEAMRRELEESESHLEPEDSWIGRSMMDAKVRFIIDGLKNNWPEF